MLAAGIITNDSAAMWVELGRWGKTKGARQCVEHMNESLHGLICTKVKPREHYPATTSIIIITCAPMPCAILLSCCVASDASPC